MRWDDSSPRFVANDLLSPTMAAQVGGIALAAAGCAFVYMQARRLHAPLDSPFQRARSRRPRFPAAHACRTMYPTSCVCPQFTQKIDAAELAAMPEDVKKLSLIHI